MWLVIGHVRGVGVSVMFLGAMAVLMLERVICVTVGVTFGDQRSEANDHHCRLD